MFIDKASIRVTAGNGGNGVVSFRREKYIPSGGPDGGDGGSGGSVILQVDDNMSTLMDFRYKRKYVAGNGTDGSGKNRNGKAGEDLVIRVPRGTVVRDKESGMLMHDMASGEFVVAKGGRGGWGNRHFATPVRQAPRFAKAGTKGQTREIVLELKLLADVGLVGFPNVGKSTLLSVVSRANPKIANYHFTTLFPNLGVVYAGEDSSFVMADIPGIIEGASEGQGLGFDFLRHIDRCRLLVHVVDISGSEGRDPIADFDAINEELWNYSDKLAERPQIVVGNKCDIVSDESQVEAFRSYVESKGYTFLKISAAAHIGVQELIQLTASELKKLPPIITYEPEYVEEVIIPQTSDDVTIEVYDDVYIVEGEWIERLINTININDTESMAYFDRTLRSAGIFRRLEDMGIREGDTVSMYDLEFEYQN